MRKARVDKNQPQVTKELRDLGFSVALSHVVGKGYPDFCVGYGGYNLFVELKSKGGKLTKDEIDFHEKYKGKVIVAFNTKEVVEGFVNYVFETEKTSINLGFMLEYLNE